MTGRLLEHSAWICKGITFDAHEAHAFFREALFGVFERLDWKLLEKIPFFKDVTWKELPLHCLPRLPAKFCIHSGQTFFPLPGSCPLFLDNILIYFEYF